MLSGIFAGVMWALETVVLGIALGWDFIAFSKDSAALAPLVCTFFHDAFSAVFLWIYVMGKEGKAQTAATFKNPDFKWLLLASAVGGPVGMTGYVTAVNYMGPSVGAIASAVYPAIGSILAFIFLKQKLKGYQWAFLLITLLGVWGIGYSPALSISNFGIGLLGAFMCAFGWGTEGVILSKCMQNDGIKSECALMIRQSTSAVVYGLVILPLLGGYDFASQFFKRENAAVLSVIALAALCATVSYLLYYKTISEKGVAKAMALNITYTAWASVFSVVLLKDFTILNVNTVACGTVIVVCAILSATDISKMRLFKKEKRNSEKTV